MPRELKSVAIKRVRATDFGTPRSFASKSSFAVGVQREQNQSGFISSESSSSSPVNSQQSPVARFAPAAVAVQKKNKRKPAFPQKMTLERSLKYLKKRVNTEYDYGDSIPLRPFARLVKELVQKYGRNKVTHMQTRAITVLLLVAENFVINLFEDLAILASHARRVTVMSKDMDTLLRICSKYDPILEEARKNLRRT